MSILQEIQEGFMNAIDDIRHTIVEQGWFGQDTTGNISDANTAIEAPEITPAQAIEPADNQQSITDMFTPPPSEDPEQTQEQDIEGMDI